jgi:hypothetical protein
MHGLKIATESTGAIDILYSISGDMESAFTKEPGAHLFV